MNDNGFLYNLERAQAGPVDEEALARKMAARTARVARAHESVFTEANGWSGQFPGTPGYRRGDRRRWGLGDLLQRQ